MEHPPTALERPVTRLLRIAAIGSVDDGKSTLIGRLLYDTKQLFDDQVAALAKASLRRGLGGLDLSLVTDGLRTEREQGITIDVAYRYATTPTRKLIIADCPGHLQYTRNMATGASNADAAVVLVDVSRGLRPQTLRHCTIAACFGVRRWVVAVNKMDLVSWSQAAYQEVVDQLGDLATRLGCDPPCYIPLCALSGANVVERAVEPTWWSGPTLLEALEGLPATEGSQHQGAGRLPVQWVLRYPTRGRGYAGMVVGGPLHRGDDVVILPSGEQSQIQEIRTHDATHSVAQPHESVTIDLADDLDVSRGDCLALASDPPAVVRSVHAMVCWFGESPAIAGNYYLVKHTTRLARGEVSAIGGRLDLDTLELKSTDCLEANELGELTLRLATPLVADPYERIRAMGSFILVDPATQVPIAAGMIREGQP